MNRDAISKLVLNAFADIYIGRERGRARILSAITEDTEIYDYPLYVNPVTALQIESSIETEFELEIPQRLWQGYSKIADFIDFIEQNLKQ